MAGGGLFYGEVTLGSPQLLADLSYKQEASGHLQPRPPSLQEQGPGRPAELEEAWR